MNDYTWFIRRRRCQCGRRNRQNVRMNECGKLWGYNCVGVSGPNDPA